MRATLLAACACVASAFSSAPAECGHPGVQLPSQCGHSTAQDFQVPQFERLPGELPFYENVDPRSQLIAGLKLQLDLDAYETPLQLRFLSLLATLQWNCVAAYHPSFLQHVWGGASTRPSVFDPNPSHHTSDARTLCATYAFAAAQPEILPDGGDSFINSIAARALGITKADVGLPPELDLDSPDRCRPSDVSCLTVYAECHGYSPRAMAAIIAQEVLYAARSDGWNSHGRMSRGARECTANCRPFTSTIPYNPYDVQGHPCTVADEGKDACWKPLLEDDGRGFFVRQEHVTPHIGVTGVPLTLTPSELQQLQAPPPNYNYTYEAQRSIELVGQLTDRTKAEVELFDGKRQVATMLEQSLFTFAGPAVTPERLMWINLGASIAEYDTTLVSWKEKVNHNLIRPTTVIHERYLDAEITTFAGPNQGVRPIAGGDYQPYVRVMPHAEYPSASACICAGLADFMDGVLEAYVGPNLSFPIQTVIPAGSSRIEPGKTPAAPVTLTYKDTTEFKLRCGESRLEGGMHFTASVPASYELCDGIGTKAFLLAFELTGSEIIPLEASTSPSCVH